MFLTTKEEDYELTKESFFQVRDWFCLLIDIAFFIAIGISYFVTGSFNIYLCVIAILAYGIPFYLAFVLSDFLQLPKEKDLVKTSEASRSTRVK